MMQQKRAGNCTAYCLIGKIKAVPMPPREAAPPLHFQSAPVTGTVHRFQIAWKFRNSPLT
jgi:hypothetical protein